MIRLVLADEHALVRAGLRAVVEAMGDTQVVAEAATGAEAVDAACAHLPDLVLMELSLPEVKGLEALASIKRRAPRSRVIMVSMHGDAQLVVRAFQAGADGFLMRAASMELRLAIDAAMAGQAYVSPCASAGLLTASRSKAHASPLDKLSPRQRQILQLLAEGHAAKAIAHKLGISVKTVETHRTALKERLDIGDLATLVRFAVRHGLVEGNDALS